MPTDLLARYCARLLIDWLNERFDAQFAITDTAGAAFLASDGSHRAGVYTAPLWEHDDAAAWDTTLRSLEERLGAGTDGAFLLWIPQGAPVPLEEPAASEFVRRVQAAAGSLPPGERTEVTFPVTVKLAKTREEGGYASVSGGFSRWWTRITEVVHGTYQVDSRAVYRVTHDGEAREELWKRIGEIARDVALGQMAEFETEDAWTLQHLPDAQDESGFALAGAPPEVDATEGIAVRRAVRRRLAAANEALAPLDVELRAVALIGSYEFGELETAGATVKALDPSLFNRFQVIAILADGDVRPTFLPRLLPWHE